MRVLAVLATAAAFAALTAVASALETRRHAVPRALLAKVPACGRERWPVKSMADPDAPSVDLHPIVSTVSKLVHFGVATGIGGARGVGVERHAYRLPVRLVAVKAEADSDIHLVVADPRTGETMIVEFTAAWCNHGADPKLRARMRRSRIALVHACGFPSNTQFVSLAGAATITGIGFFDPLHGQNGVAPNGIELHPVLTFRGHC